MMRRTLTAALCGAALIATPAVALATDDEVSPECVEAREAVGNAQAALDAAIAAQSALAIEGDLGATQAEIDRLTAADAENLNERVAAIEAVLDLESTIAVDIAAESSAVDQVCTAPTEDGADGAVEWDGPTSFGDGLYQVGRDIPAGLFRTPGSATGEFCYYARLSANDGDLDSIIANNLFQGPSSVTVTPTDAFVSFSSGCVWTLDGFDPTVPGQAPAPPVDEDTGGPTLPDERSDTGGDYDQLGAGNVPAGGVATGG